LYTAPCPLHNFTQLRQNFINDNASALSHTHFEVTCLLRLNTKTIAIALLGLAAASLSMAQSAPQTLNLSELEELMFSQSKALRGATDAVRAAGAAVDTARTFPNPEVEVMNGTRTPRPNSVGTGNYAGTLKTISVTQELDMPWHRFPRVDGAMAGYSAAQANEQSFRSDMRAQLRMRYYDLIRRQAEERATADDAKAAQAMRKRIELRVQTGEDARFELVKADADMLNAQKLAESAALRIRQSRGALRAMVGPELPEAFAVADLPHKFAPPPPFEQVRTEVLTNNPELLRTRAERQQFDRKLSEEKALRFPKIALRADQDLDPDYRSKRVGVAMSLPLWDWRGGPVGEAVAKLSQSDNELAYQEFSLIQSLEAAYQQYNIANAQAVALDGGLVRQAADAVRIVELGYKAGEKSFLEVLDAQRVYRAARNELITAQFELAGAWTEIERIRAIAR
jgi:cobalt-zinc-cadmium efflux system outer membrane protein